MIFSIIVLYIIGQATNRDDENFLTDSEIESSKVKEDKRKLSSTVEEYELGKKVESQEKEDNNLTKEIESGRFLNLLFLSIPAFIIFIMNNI